MATSVYAIPSDELAGTVTPILRAGSTDSAYPLANLRDLLLDTMWRAGSAAATEFEFVFGAPRTIGPVALMNIVADAGTVINVCWTNTAWPGAMPGGDTTNITVAASRADGKRLSPYVLTNSGSKQYLRVRFAAQAGIPVELGEIKICSLKRSLLTDFRPPLEFTPRRANSVQQSDVEAERVFTFGVTLRRMSIGGWIMDDAGLAAWNALAEGVNHTEKPFLFILDPAVQDAMLVRFREAPTVRKTEMGIYETNFAIEEVSGGVPSR